MWANWCLKWPLMNAYSGGQTKHWCSPSGLTETFHRVYNKLAQKCPCTAWNWLQSTIWSTLFPGEQVVINKKLRSTSKNESGVFVEEVNICKKVYWFTSFSLFHIAYGLRGSTGSTSFVSTNRPKYYHFFTTRARKPVIPMLYVMQINEVICVVM